MTMVPVHITTPTGMIPPGTGGSQAGTTASSSFAALMGALMGDKMTLPEAVAPDAGAAAGSELYSQLSLAGVRLIIQADDGEAAHDGAAGGAGNAIQAVLRIADDDGEVTEIPVTLVLPPSVEGNPAIPESTVTHRLSDTVLASGAVQVMLETTAVISDTSQLTVVWQRTALPSGVKIAIPAADSGSEEYPMFEADTNVSAGSALKGGLHQAALLTPPLAAGETPGYIHRIAAQKHGLEFITPATGYRPPEQSPAAQQVSPANETDSMPGQAATVNKTPLVTAADAIEYPVIPVPGMENGDTEPVAAANQIKIVIDGPTVAADTPGSPLSAQDGSRVTIILPSSAAMANEDGQAKLQQLAALLAGDGDASALTIEISSAASTGESFDAAAFRRITDIAPARTDSVTAGTPTGTGTPTPGPGEPAAVPLVETPEPVFPAMKASAQDAGTLPGASTVIDTPDAVPVADDAATAVDFQRAASSGDEITVPGGREPVSPDATGDHTPPVRIHPVAGKLHYSESAPEKLAPPVARADENPKNMNFAEKPDPVPVERGTGTGNARTVTRFNEQVTTVDGVSRQPATAPTRAINDNSTLDTPAMTSDKPAAISVEPRNMRDMVNTAAATEHPARRGDMPAEPAAKPVVVEIPDADAQTRQTEPGDVPFTGKTGESEHASVMTGHDVDADPSLPVSDHDAESHRATAAGESDSTVTPVRRETGLTERTKISGEPPDGSAASAQSTVLSGEPDESIGADGRQPANGDDAADVISQAKPNHIDGNVPEAERRTVSRQPADVRIRSGSHRGGVVSHLARTSNDDRGGDADMAQSRQPSVSMEQRTAVSQADGQGFESLFAVAAANGDNMAAAQKSPDASGDLDGIDPVATGNGHAGISHDTASVEGTKAAKADMTPFRSDLADRQEQVLSTIVRYARIMVQQGKSAATIKLEPPSLGKIQLEISTDHTRVTGRIVVEKSEVRDMVQQHMAELRESLAQNGLKVESFDVQVGHNGGTDNWARRQMMESQRSPESSGSVPQGTQAVSSETAMPAARPGRAILNGTVDLWI